MKTAKPVLINLLLMLSLLLVSCNSDTKKQAGKTSNEEFSTKQNETIPVFTETVPNQKRLTSQSLMTYFPANFLGLEKSGKPKIKQDEVSMAKSTWIRQNYFKSGENATIVLADLAEDKKAISEFANTVSSINVDTPSDKANYYIDSDGLRIIENEQYQNENGKKIRSKSQVSLRNARFFITLSSSPQLEEEAKSVEDLLKAYKESNLSKLFQLPVPGVDNTDQMSQEASRYLTLDCNKLLPLENVQSICGIENLKLQVDDFEKENNCSRSYNYIGSSASVVFLITQYARSGNSKSAVDIQGKNKEKKEGDIEGLGNSAHIETAGGNLYLTVAYENYLLELRSFQDKYDKKECCVCFSREKLIEIARDIIPRLDKLN